MNKAPFIGMARGELLRKLFQSYTANNNYEFHAVALEIISEEEQKQNHALARDLLNILDGPKSNIKTKTTPPKNESTPIDRDRQVQLVQLKTPTHSLQDAILKIKTREQILRILSEYNRSEILKMHGLRPKTKILFYGPPGCGKTLCADIIAQELHLPLLYTRFDGIVSSLLGETSANLRKVFDYAKTGKFVILFDEFDAIGKSRDTHQDHGELKRVVNSFLQILDDFQSDSIIIAATNNPKILDHALWRRFDEVIQFERPTIGEIRLLLDMKLKNYPIEGIDLNHTAKELFGVSHSEVEWVCLDAIKTAIIEDVGVVTQDIIDNSIQRQKSRKIVKNLT